MEYKKDDLIDMLATGKVSRRKFQSYLASLGGRGGDASDAAALRAGRGR